MDVNFIEGLIKDFACDPDKHRKHCQAEFIYTVINIIEAAHELPDDALQIIRKQCVQHLGKERQDRHIFNRIHYLLTGSKYYETKKKTSFVNPVNEKRVRRLADVESRICKYVSSCRTITQEERLAVLLYFAAVEGGLCHEPGLKALMEAVIHQPEVFTQCGGERYIRLKYASAGHPVNVSTGEERNSSQAYYPPPLTTASQIGFMRTRDISKCADQAVHRKAEKKKLTKNPLELIRLLLVDLMKDASLLKLSDSALYEALATKYSKRPGAQVPSFIYFNAMGKLNGVSTFDESLLALNTEHCAEQVINSKRVAQSRGRSNKGSLDKRNFITTNDSLMYEMREVFKLHDGEFKGNLIHDAFVELLNKGQPKGEPAKALLLWFIYNYKNKTWNTAATGTRVLSCVGKVWLAATEGKFNEEEFYDEEETSRLHQELITLEGKSDKAFPRRLLSFWRFMHEELEYAAPEQLENFARRSTFVRAALPSASHIRRLLTDIAQVFRNRSRHHVETATAMLILMARLGLRPAEARHLKVRDIDLRGDGRVFIRKNERFTPKRFASRRSLGFGPFMMPDEELFFRHYCRRRQVETKALTSPFLFTEHELSSDLISYDELRDNASQLLTAYLGLPRELAHSLNLYQLRHYALSACQLVCFASRERASHITGYSEQQILNIQKYFKGSGHQDTLFMISSFAGHLETDMTVKTYFHFTDILRYEAAMRSNMEHEPDLLASLTSMQPGRVRRQAIGMGYSGLLNNQAMMSVLDALLKNERQHWVKSLKPRKLPMKKGVKTFRIKTRRHHEDVQTILHAHDDGIPHSEIAEAFCLELEWVKRIIEAASHYRFDALQRTQNGLARLYPRRSSSGVHEHLHVTMPKSDRIPEMMEILGNLVSKKRQKRMKKVAETILQKVSARRNFISFNNSQAAKTILLALQQIVPLDRWSVILYANKYNATVCETHWRNALGGSVDMEVCIREYDSRSKFGRIDLSYMNIGASDLKKTWAVEAGVVRESSRALIAALHLYVIYIRASSGCNGFS